MINKKEEQFLCLHLTEHATMLSSHNYKSLAERTTGTEHNEIILS